MLWVGHCAALPQPTSRRHYGRLAAAIASRAAQPGFRRRRSRGRLDPVPRGEGEGGGAGGLGGLGGGGLGLPFNETSIVLLLFTLRPMP
jgi:hypothetical protein